MMEAKQIIGKFNRESGNKDEYGVKVHYDSTRIVLRYPPQLLIGIEEECARKERKKSN